MEMVERILLLQLWMDEVPRAFAISDTQSSPARDECSEVACFMEVRLGLFKLMLD